MILVKESSNDQHQSYQVQKNFKSLNKNCHRRKNIHLYEVNIFSKAKFGLF